MQTTSIGSVVQLPAATLWSRVAAKYADYVLRGDPRAGCFYLEHQLSVLKLSRSPAALREAIKKEFGRRGIDGEPRFCR